MELVQHSVQSSRPLRSVNSSSEPTCQRTHPSPTSGF